MHWLAERCIREGMGDYLPRPVRISMLEDILDKWLGGVREKSA